MFGLVQLFNVDQERNIPTFFTVVVALSNALLLLLIGMNSDSNGSRESRYWYALAIGFFFIAYDEGFQVHEKLTAPVRDVLGGTDLGVFYFGWVVPGIALVGVLWVFFARFLLLLTPVTRHRMLAAAAVYLSGCLGMEMLDGAYAEMYGQNLTYSFLVTIEEGMEMAGLVMLVRTLLEHFAYQRVNLAFIANYRLQPRAEPEHRLIWTEPER